ncbi:MAG: sulfur carrier protein ThiS [Bryobacteraceae bacterium]
MRNRVSNPVVAQQIEIVVNGERRTVPSGQNLVEILANLGLEADRVAVELDRAIIRKSDWEKTVVPDGAHLEVVQFVGGG